MLKILTAAIATALLASAAHAAPSPAERVARDYLAAYSALDMQAMAKLLDPAAIFADQTAAPADGGPIVVDGRDAFLKQLKTYGLQRLDYELSTVFESNGRTVFQGFVNAYYSRQDGRVLRWRSDIVTVITVESGMVVRHEDFANYPAAAKTVENAPS